MNSEIARLRSHNLMLQRRLERARRDALLYAAQFCEDHVPQAYGLRHVVTGKEYKHAGHMYAAKLREIAG